jgi:hypothetical protein
MKWHIFIFLNIVCSLVYCQKYNHQWPYGYGSNLPLNFGFSMIDFNNQSVSVAVLGELDNFDFGDNGSFICNKNGQLQLMSNNCTIRDRNFNIVENSDTLTPGVTWDNFCADGDGYPSSQNALFLPEIDNDTVYYLLHKDRYLSNQFQDVICQNFYLSIVIKKQNGKYYLKERKKIRSGVLGVSKVTATLNADGTKWWTFITDFNSNKFYAYEIGGAELISPPVQSILGISITNDETGLAQACFSTDSKILAINNRPPTGVMLYDFDNATGIFSNYRSINYQNLIPNSPEGVAFSPNNRFLYLTAARHIWQMDLMPENSADSIYDMGEVSLPDETGWPIGVGNMALGPDCRVYVGPGTTTYYIHVIHHPDQKCPDCNFEIKAIRSPTILHFDLPNTINYLPNGQCDDSISWGIVPAYAAPNEENKVVLFPNPAKDVINIKSSIIGRGEIELYDVSGRLLAQKSIDESMAQIDVSAFPNGIYFYVATLHGVRYNGKISVLH